MRPTLARRGRGRRRESATAPPAATNSANHRASGSVRQPGFSTASAWASGRPRVDTGAERAGRARRGHDPDDRERRALTRHGPAEHRAAAPKRRRHADSLSTATGGAAGRSSAETSGRPRRIGAADHDRSSRRRRPRSSSAARRPRRAARPAADWPTAWRARPSMLLADRSTSRNDRRNPVRPAVLDDRDRRSASPCRADTGRSRSGARQARGQQHGEHADRQRGRGAEDRQRRLADPAPRQSQVAHARRGRRERQSDSAARGERPDNRRHLAARARARAAHGRRRCPHPPIVVLEIVDDRRRRAGRGTIAAQQRRRPAAAPRGSPIAPAARPRARARMRSHRRRPPAAAPAGRAPRPGSSAAAGRRRRRRRPAAR